MVGKRLTPHCLTIKQETFAQELITCGNASAAYRLAYNASRMGMYTKVYQELMVDGLLGSKTLSALDRYLDIQPGDRESNEKILLYCMNGEQYVHYKENPQHPYFRGWF